MKYIVNLGLKELHSGLRNSNHWEVVSAGHFDCWATLSRSDFSAPKSYFDQMVWLAWDPLQTHHINREIRIKLTNAQ